MRPPWTGYSISRCRGNPRLYGTPNTHTLYIILSFDSNRKKERERETKIGPLSEFGFANYPPLVYCMNIHPRVRYNYIHCARLIDPNRSRTMNRYMYIYTASRFFFFFEQRILLPRQEINNSSFLAHPNTYTRVIYIRETIESVSRRVPKSRHALSLSSFRECIYRVLGANNIHIYRLYLTC